MRKRIDPNLHNVSTRILVVLSAGGLLAGCGPAVHNATIESPGTIAATPEQATIVVVQPSTHFRSVNILDAAGQLIGQVNDRSYTVVQVPAGPTRLYAVPERKARMGDRVDGTVQAGRVYYATISLCWGGVSFLALNPRSRDARWAQKNQYLAEAPHVQIDAQKAPTAIREIGDPAPLLRQVDHFVDGLDANHRQERVIQAEDGI